MGWLDWLTGKRQDAEVNIEPQPVAVNPTRGERADRNRERIKRLEAAIAAGDTRPELKKELERRKKQGA